jgi:hypothetical protein
MNLDYPPCTNITDADQNTAALEVFVELAKHEPVRAPKGKAIVWFMPYRKEGLIDISQVDRPNSVEAVIVHDNTGYGLQPGIKLMAHPKVGLIWKHHGISLVTLPADAMIAIEEVAA